jgi:hypothetical protein
MSNLYLDIETIPSQSPAVHALIAEGVTPPGNISKADTIAAWHADKKPALVDEAIAKTSFDGALGHICCIGHAWGDEEPRSHCIATVKTERDFLADFFGIVSKRIGGLGTVTIVGHNVIAFDIRFIWQRAIVLGVRVPSWFPRDPKPWSGEVFDTMTAFAGSRGTIGMDRLSRALGFPGKGDVDGSMVAAMWAAGKYEEIAAYCRSDIERTREIHRKMMVAFGEVVA